MVFHDYQQKIASWHKLGRGSQRSPEDSPHGRHPSTPRILRSLVSGMQHLFQKKQRVLCQQEKGQRKPAQPASVVCSIQCQPYTISGTNSASPSVPRVLGSLRQVYVGEHVGSRRNRASWTGSLPAFILSQETELRPRTLGTFLARGESSYRESSDPRTQEVDQSSRLLDICPKRGEFAYTECFDHWNSGESWTPRSADRG